jgi:hypothetical protein
MGNGGAFQGPGEEALIIGAQFNSGKAAKRDEWGK